jgi:predicted methyltransferase
MNRLSCIALATVLGFGCATAPPASSELVSAADRTDRDRSMDSARKPQEMLAFLGVRPGMRVAEVGAGGGYTTELLARAVGPLRNVASMPAASPAAQTERHQGREEPEHWRASGDRAATGHWIQSRPTSWTAPVRRTSTRRSAICHPTIR